MDGQNTSDTTKLRVRAHRNSCEPCCNFHDGLLGIAAITNEMDPPVEFTTTQSSRLWNRIVDSVDTNGTERVSLSKLDAGKIDMPSSGDPRYFDLGKFLFGPEELESFKHVVDPSHQNPRIERVAQDTLNLLAKLQDVVFDLPTVVGTMVLSPDGSILDSRLARDMRDSGSEDISVWSIAAYHNAQAAANAFGFNRVTQIVSRTETGYVIIANLEGMTLIVLINGGEDDAWNAVSRLSAIAN